MHNSVCICENFQRHNGLFNHDPGAKHANGYRFLGFLLTFLCGCEMGSTVDIFQVVRKHLRVYYTSFWAEKDQMMVKINL